MPKKSVIFDQIGEGFDDVFSTLIQEKKKRFIIGYDIDTIEFNYHNVLEKEIFPIMTGAERLNFCTFLIETTESDLEKRSEELLKVLKRLGCPRIRVFKMMVGEGIPAKP